MLALNYRPRRDSRVSQSAALQGIACSDSAPVKPVLQPTHSKHTRHIHTARWIQVISCPSRAAFTAQSLSSHSWHQMEGPVSGTATKTFVSLPVLLYITSTQGTPLCTSVERETMALESTKQYAKSSSSSLRNLELSVSALLTLIFR